MKLDKIISNLSYQELSERFENQFERIENQETVDSVGMYKTTLKLEVEIKGGLNMEFPAKLKLTRKGMTTKLHIDLDPTKIIIVSLVVVLLLGGLFYLLNGNLLNAGIFGALTGTFFFLFLRGAVSKSLSAYANNLTKVENPT